MDSRVGQLRSEPRKAQRRAMRFVTWMKVYTPTTPVRTNGLEVAKFSQLAMYLLRPEPAEGAGRQQSIDQAVKHVL